MIELSESESPRRGGLGRPTKNRNRHVARNGAQKAAGARSGGCGANSGRWRTAGGKVSSRVMMAMQSNDLRRKLPPANRVPALPPHVTRGENGLGGQSRPLPRVPHSGTRKCGTRMSIPQGIERAVRQTQVQTDPPSAATLGRKSCIPYVSPIQAGRRCIESAPRRW